MIFLEERPGCEDLLIAVVSEVSSRLTENYSGFKTWFQKFLKVTTLKISYLQLVILCV